MPTTDQALPTAAPAAPPPAHRRRWGRYAAGALALVVALGAGAWWLNGRVHPKVLGTGCTAVAGGRTVTLDPEQAGNAAIITAVAVRRHLPARAATIALATALQESKLRNLDYGDRDSLGLFQQRPSQGWGTKAQVTDPVYASNAFYDVLVRIEGYRNLPVTKAAQKVQRSAFPSAYAAHEADARVLASALSGYSPASFTCVVSAPTASHASSSAGALTPHAAALAAAANRELGATATASGTDGTTLDVALPQVAGGSTADEWAIAQWAVARADGLQVVAVTTGSRTWSRSDHPDRWTGSAVKTLPGHALVQVG